MPETEYILRLRHHHGAAEGGSTPHTPQSHHQQHSTTCTAQHDERHARVLQPAQGEAKGGTGAVIASNGRPPLQPSLRWLQVCLLLLFAQDVFCFSLGYPFLPQYLSERGHSSSGVALAFGIYGVASIGALLLLLLKQSASSGSSNSTACKSSAQQPAAKYWLILASTSLSAAAGAANTLLPDSYVVLLGTKAVQGAASALYFVYTLALVAMVFPAVYKTQAMAFVSAGLTLGDALGPVVGGIVYQSKGLQQALGMQPIASGVALLALLLLVAAWPSRRRPWSLCAAQHTHQHNMQQHGRQHVDVEHAAAELTVPLLEQQRHREACLSTAATTVAVASSAVAPTKQKTPSVLQLLSNRGILSLCMLALMCQAARTAIDLLLPMLLQDSVQPGIIGLLFAGEAVGSVATPFVVDWLLHRKVSGIELGANLNDDEQQHQHHVSLSFASHTQRCHRSDVQQTDASLAAVSGSPDCSQQGRQRFRDATKHENEDGNSSGSAAAAAANQLLFFSAIGMAVCCCLVLTAWQLPAVCCRLVPHSSSSSGGGGAVLLPAWICPPIDAANSAAVAAAGADALYSSFGSAAVESIVGWFGEQSLLCGMLLSFRGSQLTGPWTSEARTLYSSHDSGGAAPHVAMANMTTAAGIGALSLSRAGLAAHLEVPSRIAFSNLQLVLTGLVLLLLGGCHSSCEALIYTVLTDLVTAGKASSSATQGSKPKQTFSPAKVGTAALPSHDRKGVATQLDHMQGDQLYHPALHADRQCVMKPTCETVSCGTTAHQDIPCSADDCTEGVMVLYVLFWVVGFTAGACAAGLPGPSVLMQQLMGCVMGLILGVSALWSWKQAIATL